MCHLRQLHLRRYRRNDAARHLFLDGEHILQRPVIALGPQMVAGGRIDQLGGHPHPVSGLADAALDHVAHAQLSPDLLNIHRLALVGEGAVARDHQQRAEPRQLGDDVLDHAVGEVLLLPVAAHVLEWQYRDRRLVGQRGRGGWQARRRRSFAEPDSVHPHRSGDVLEALLAHVLESGVDLADDIAVNTVRDADAARLG
jgi:hypothetical protein